MPTPQSLLFGIAHLQFFNCTRWGDPFAAWPLNQNSFFAVFINARRSWLTFLRQERRAESVPRRRSSCLSFACLANQLVVAICFLGSLAHHALRRRMVTGSIPTMGFDVCVCVRQLNKQFFNFHWLFGKQYILESESRNTYWNN